MRPPAVYLAVWLAGVLGFVAVAFLAAARETFPADIWLSHRLQDIDGRAVADVLDWGSEPANIPLLAVVWLGASLAALVSIGRWQAALVLASMGGRALNSGLKEVIERPRPSPSIVHTEGQPDSFSFPSGHAEGTLVLYGLIFYLSTVYVPNARLRLPLQVACAGVVAFTGLERVHSGDHWPSDVMGGFWLGMLVLVGVIVAERLVRRVGRE